MSIHEVAEQAGVSPATVSRAFNMPQRVRPETLARVRDAALALGYRPNSSARTLRTQRSRTLGVVLPTLLNPVFAECLDGIARAAAEAGYAIMPLTTRYRTAEELEAAERLAAAGCDGVLLVVSDPRSSTALRCLRLRGVPYVLIYNRDAAEPCVSVDCAQAVEALVARLVGLGHERIAMVCGHLAASDRSQQRLQGYAAGMLHAGLAPRCLEVPFIDTMADALAPALASPERPTALVCSNDLLAIRAIRVATSRGLAVPEDLSVVGFDGIALGADLTPALSTIAQPNADMGRSAVKLLARALAGPGERDAPRSLTFECRFHPGESCGNRPDIVRSAGRLAAPAHPSLAS